MRFYRALLSLPLLLAPACKRPDVEAFRRSPAPVVVSFDVPASVPDRDVHARDYAAALRAKAATRLEVVPEGVEAPSNADHLQVVITGYRVAERSVPPGAIGVAAGVGAGILSAAAGSRSAVWDGFWWGLFTHGAAAEAQNRKERLGFRPIRVEARVRMTRAKGRTVLADFDVDPEEVMEALEPLRPEEENDPARISEVEAKALARVIVRQLDAILELRVYEPRWYKPPQVEER